MGIQVEADLATKSMCFRNDCTTLSLHTIKWCISSCRVERIPELESLPMFRTTSDLSHWSPLNMGLERTLIFIPMPLVSCLEILILLECSQWDRHGQSCPNAGCRLDQSEAHGDQYGEEVAELCTLVKRVEGTFYAVSHVFHVSYFQSS